MNPNDDNLTMDEWRRVITWLLRHPTEFNIIRWLSAQPAEMNRAAWEKGVTE